MTRSVGYRWHLRAVMAARGLFATTELGPLLAERGVSLSREQVYRLVAGTPERLNLTTLSALCDILEVTPADLVEVTVEVGRATKARSSNAPAPALGTVSDLRPRRARIVRDDKT
ncbi:MAG: helix-turn-helix transcriptional regulator [Nitriliruptoraceae bacterium]